MGGGEISIGTRVRKNIGGGSSYHPMRNRTAIDVPVFGSEPDWNQCHPYGQDLRIEALRCTDRRRNPGKFVNILHASTDLESSRDATDRLVSLMGEMGFNCQRRGGSYFEPSSDQSDVDVVIVGCDKNHHNDVAYFIKERMARGFLEIVPELDVLWYGTDYIPQPPQNMDLLCSDRNFSVEAACMVRAHIRRRGNIEMWRGSCVSMMIRIENIIDRMLNTGSDGAWIKIHRFEDRVRKDGQWGPDADLFFAALTVIHDARDMASHPSDRMPDRRRREIKIISKHLADNFNNLADMHRRPYLKFKHGTSEPTLDYKRLKWMNGLAQIAVAWITNYSKTCAR